MASDLSQVLTVEEAAAELRIGRTAAYDAVRRGDLPVVRIGRIIRVPRAALDRMLQLNEDGRAP
jgi:excisionase family DNA binding protein